MSGEHLNGFIKEWSELGLESSGPVFPTWQGPEAVKLAVRALRGLPIHDYYLLQPAPILDAETAVVEDASDDYWVEGYLSDEQIQQIFPN
jgi:ribose transport system substrate-binding protein